ncbi:neurofilament heavy polypeptide [Zeugodacus cucurbitae]|uniref:neurofilament heavy polypeptide n=1 Tax=Zeugodacus cucurbitae TaxID=28588 RepID=UPI0023D92C1E|nr:neurofilament heavy polypeptide [Zeugodacus cucurbitae]
MRQIIILASLVVCCVAAPTSQQTSAEDKVHDFLLQRPSPINPDVPSDPKPDEKITKITDPKEIVKHKREAEDNPYDHISRFAPTALPIKQVENKHSQESSEHSLEADSTHHRQKREKGQVKETKKSTKVSTPSPVPSRKAVVKKEARNHARSHNTPTTSRSKVSAVPVPAPARDLPYSRQRRQVDPHLIGASTVAVTPLLLQEAQHEKNSEDSHAAEIGEDAEAPKSESAEVAAPVKRDIPVPLVPKYHHPEESPKSGESDNKSNESVESDESKEDSKEKTPVIQAQNVPISQHQETASITTVNKEELEVHSTPIPKQDKPAEAQNINTAIEHINEPLVEQLTDIEPTEIIDYETPAGKESVTIKHPIPVAELFSKHKPT